MADKDSGSSGTSLPTTGLIWLAMIAAGAIFVHQVPWQERRPNSGELKTYRQASEQTVDARLWQDPLSAVRAGIDEEKKRTTPAPNAGTVVTTNPRSGAKTAVKRDVPPPHSLALLGEQVRERACEARAPVTVLGVMLPGAPYFEAVESRRRARFAVLAALNTAQYVPDDSEHLGYVAPDTSTGLPEFIGYEWLSPRVGGPSVLAIWLDEAVFGTRTVERLTRLVDGMTPAPCADTGAPNLLRFNVIGPAFSWTLADILQFDRSGADASRFTFYAYGPTVPWSVLLDRPDAGPADIERALQLRGLNLFRTIGTDDALAATLATELKSRNVDPAANCGKPEAQWQHVALIAEWDTSYGRALPDEMAKRIGNAKCPGAFGSRDWIHPYSYLRGLDGELPGTSQASTSSSSKDKTGGSGSDKDRSMEIEKAEGQNQVDYLRRLSNQMRALDTEWKSRGGTGFRAIGVLGSDIYDKLLILQALRDQFPDAIFFTTDLDARLLHPQEQAWTRNLLVASNFGLQLHPRLQNDIAPFRDSYQSSIFFSTLVALHDMQEACGMDWECITRDKLRDWLAKPRLFEIGKTSAFDYGERVSDDACTGARNLIDCQTIHPSGSPMFPRPSASVLRGVLVLVLGIAILVGLAKGSVQQLCRSLVGEEVDRETRWYTRFVTAAWLAMLIVVAWHADALWYTAATKLTDHGAGEPFSFTEGISIWPTELIRLVAAVLAWIFIVVSWKRMKANLDDISDHLRFEPQHEVLEQFVDHEVKTWSWRKRILRTFSFRLDEYDGPHDPVTRADKDLAYFWRKYLYQGKGLSRGLRTAGAVVAFAIVASILVFTLGAPTTPSRGAVSGVVNMVVLWAAVLSMLALIFFVVDATVFSAQFIRAMLRPMGPLEERHPDAVNSGFWPKKTRDHYATLFAIPQRYLDPWITMDFIALRTRFVSNLIYLPFVVISLMIVSRSRFFDKWNMPLGLLLVFASSVLIIIFCGAALRETAEAARKQAVRCLSDDVVRLRAGSDEDRRTASQLELMIARIQALREGAFASYTQQPLFKALLLSLGSFGGTALLDYLTVASF